MNNFSCILHILRKITIKKPFAKPIEEFTEKERTKKRSVFTSHWQPPWKQNHKSKIFHQAKNLHSLKIRLNKWTRDNKVGSSGKPGSSTLTSVVDISATTTWLGHNSNNLAHTRFNSSTITKRNAALYSFFRKNYNKSKFSSVNDSIKNKRFSFFILYRFFSCFQLSSNFISHRSGYRCN